MKNRTVLATLTMVGTIVGAGIFGVPFVFARAGILIGLTHVAVLGVAVLLIHTLYIDVILATAGKHRFVGYVTRWLGPRSARLAAVTATVSYVGALIAYIILAGSFLSLLFGGDPFFWSLVFFALMAFVQSMPIVAMEELGSTLTTLLILTAIAILGFVIPHARPANFFVVHPQEWFSPYGVVFFAFSGASVIPTIVDFLKREKRQAMRAVIGGTVIAIALTALFGTVVVLALGAATEENAISGLVPVVGRGIVTLGSIFGLLAMAGTFTSLANSLKEQCRLDFKFPAGLAWAAAIGAPLALYLAGIRSFITVIGFLGAVSGVIFGALILLMAWKLPRERLHWAIPPVIVLFMLGLLTELIHLTL